ncbi:cell wall hydrolase [Neobacillus sp. K501]
MKNIKKKLVVACAATIAFIGINNTANAMSENQVITNDYFWDFDNPAGLIVDDNNPENTGHVDWIYIREILGNEQTDVQPEPTEVTESAPVAPAVSISDEEKDLFARLVEAEAKGESYEGKVAVATVVLNRVESPHFPNTITGVINEVVGDAFAFSPVQNGEIKNPASDEAIRAVEESLTRQERLNDCIYFYNPDIATDNWIRTREVVTTIGNHVFAK